MSDSVLKFLGGVIGGGMWFTLVLLHFTPAQPFIDALMLVFGTLGLLHGSLAIQNFANSKKSE